MLDKIVSITSTVYTLSRGDEGQYIRLEAAGAKTANILGEASLSIYHRLQLWGEWNIRNASTSGDVTLVPGPGVTLNTPAGGTLVLNPGSTVTLIQIDEDEFDVLGQTEAA